MKICGLNKTTLLDYPGKVAATVFLGGCNYRCPFCHNSSLLCPNNETPALSQEEVLTFLEKRRRILDGVCITGGEPTLSAQLPDFLRQIHSLGLSIKLDSNGTHPEVIKALAESGLIDAVAMDIKASPENYPASAGVSEPLLDKIEESVRFLMSGSLPYEFRTTVVKQLHTEQDFISIGKWLAKARAYYLQAYKESPEVLKPGFSSYTRHELERFRDILRKTIPIVEIRGID